MSYAFRMAAEWEDRVGSFELDATGAGELPLTISGEMIGVDRAGIYRITVSGSVSVISATNATIELRRPSAIFPVPAATRVYVELPPGLTQQSATFVAELRDGEYVSLMAEASGSTEMRWQHATVLVEYFGD